jgi:mono/diheme cytochrome c family protein
MGSLARALTDEDKIRLALYYAGKELAPAGSGDPALLDKGRNLYERFCVECHGIDGRGREGYARLAGQQPGYLVKVLDAFKSGTGARYNPWMSEPAALLESDEDVRAVAAFLAGLE